MDVVEFVHAINNYTSVHTVAGWVMGIGFVMICSLGFFLLGAIFAEWLDRLQTKE